ncbi:xylose isomerase [Verrucomicrobia bacterium LW23]|nr:xylose isomerase [Verrucomicrobia bacterium LW23]
MWSFGRNSNTPAQELLREAARIGYSGVEMLDEASWPMAIDCGLQVVTTKGHDSLRDGLNRRENRNRIVDELLDRIAKAKKWSVPVLICFTGDRAADVDDRQGLETSAETLQMVAPAALEAGVTLAVELLNSKVDHKGYQGDSTSWGIELCKQADSSAVRLLYDIYHMQIMEGDLIRTIREAAPYIAHYHTAGNPGRGQPDASQEINYPAVYRAIAATGYSGFIGHEFVPKGDPVEALRLAYNDCACVKR